VNKEDQRQLVVNGRVNGISDTAEWRSDLRYVAVLDLPTHFFANPGRVLIIGLGGGSTAKNYARHGWSVDIVESDTVLIQAVRNSFGFGPKDGTIHQADARTFLNSSAASYEVVLIDGLSGADFPYECLTKEAFQLIANHLTDDGVLAVSLESIGWHDEVTSTLAATLAECFPRVFVLPMAEPPNKFGSIVLLALRAKRDDLLRDTERNDLHSPFWRYGPEYQKTHAWDNHFVADIHNARVQTDAANDWARILRHVEEEGNRLRHTADSLDFLP